ncbi:hypothetical protein CARN8_1340003 [mine drainage metagenome]|uniref:Uncharacterized protein n=1 Tax=mine drainage metagenome TaxID=410659 RepID=A0A3P3ZLR8_9ZZZZ
MTLWSGGKSILDNSSDVKLKGCQKFRVEFVTVRGNGGENHLEPKNRLMKWCLSSSFWIFSGGVMKFSPQFLICPC